VLARPGNGKRGNAQQEQFRHGFGNALAEQESGGLVDRYAIPGPGRPLFEASAANLKKSSPAVDAGKRDRGPLPSTGAERDRTVPEAAEGRVRRRPRRRCRFRPAGDGDLRKCAHKRV
jgi:non-heme chloroperoxidase